jgi:hypothetical protein
LSRIPIGWDIHHSFQMHRDWERAASAEAGTDGLALLQSVLSLRKLWECPIYRTQHPYFD